MNDKQIQTLVPLLGFILGMIAAPDLVSYVFGATLIIILLVLFGHIKFE